MFSIPNLNSWSQMYFGIHSSLYFRKLPVVYFVTPLAESGIAPLIKHVNISATLGV